MGRALPWSSHGHVAYSLSINWLVPLSPPGPSSRCDFLFSRSPSLFSCASALWARLHQHSNNKDVARFLVPPCCDPICLSSVSGHGLWSQPFLLSGKDSQSASYLVSENQEISLTVSPQLLLSDQTRPGNSRWLKVTCIDIFFFSSLPNSWHIVVFIPTVSFSLHFTMKGGIKWSETNVLALGGPFEISLLPWIPALIKQSIHKD